VLGVVVVEGVVVWVVDVVVGVVELLPIAARAPPPPAASTPPATRARRNFFGEMAPSFLVSGKAKQRNLTAP
jgi:hypothetical protein